MTIAESLELEGYLKGYTESYQESQRETILKIAHSLLAEGVDRTLVKKVTGLRDEDLTQ
ncbi:Rpn family recombination-promoting nuclease/putative transposase [Yersinia kristensenii]|uniref:Rpn family recombination-promoting nuclease/putative transposase n=1 Tax=Yersinia kristensenii TaxID=28152 RepID=UPI001595C9EA|nr:Rpn family recombination-promoting nuclease/putative transposase [Yersinia kristensenii]